MASFVLAAGAFGAKTGVIGNSLINIFAGSGGRPGCVQLAKLLLVACFCGLCFANQVK